MQLLSDKIYRPEMQENRLAPMDGLHSMEINFLIWTENVFQTIFTKQKTACETYHQLHNDWAKLC